MDDVLVGFERKSRYWIENSPVCTKILDSDLNLQYMSKAGMNDLKITDISKYYGKPYPFNFYPESFKHPMHENLQKAKSTGDVLTLTAPILNLNGEELWYQSTITPVFTDEKIIDYIMVVSVEITKQKQAELEDIRIKEIHHRIKNNLQIVSSLLSLQANIVDNPEFEKSIRDSIQRISAIAAVHEQMYQSGNMKEVFVKAYVEDLFANISSTYWARDKAFQKELNIGRFKMNMDQLVPCSLILNEIITNAFKYGFDKNPNPCLTIDIQKNENTILMQLGDNGNGFDKDYNKENSTSLGMTLIYLLAEQINAQIKVKSQPGEGVQYTINIPTYS